MHMPEVMINYWAVLVAGLASMVIGSVWYSPVLFANKWMQLLGWNAQQVKEAGKGAGQALFGMFVGCLLSAFVMAHFIDFTLSDTALEGAVTAFWIWLGFIVTTFVSMPLFERKPWALFFINVGYYLVSFVVMGIILAIWA